MRYWLPLFLLLASGLAAAAPVDDCTTPQDSATATLELTLPTHDDGDLLLTFATMNDNQTIVLNEAGWTTIDVVDDAAGGDKSIGAWYKIASSESGTYTIQDDGVTSHIFNGMMCAVSAFDSGTVEDAANTTSTGTTNSATHDPAAITTANDNALVFTLVGAVQTDGTTLTQPAGHTLAGQNTRASHDMGVSYIDAGTAGAEDPGTWSGFGAGADSASITFAIRADATAPPTFSSDPATLSCTDTGCTFGYTANASGDTLYGMATDVQASAPTSDQIKAQTGSHGAANEVTTGVADQLTITVTDSPEFPVYAFHFFLEDSGGQDSDVVTIAEQSLSAPSGFRFSRILTIGSGSICEDFNAAADPDIAANDFLVDPIDTSPSDYDFTIRSDCHIAYAGDSSRQNVLNMAIYDDSAVGYHGNDIDAWFNNKKPVSDATLVEAFTINEAIAAINIANGSGEPLCTDADDETLTVSLTSGSLPTGISQGGTGSGTLSGTPTVENESGASLTFTCTDVVGDSTTQPMVLYPIDTVTLPDCITNADTLSECQGRFDALFAWNDNLPLVVSAVDCGSDPENQVTAMTPGESTEVSFDTIPSVVLSYGTTCADMLDRRRRVK